MQRGLSRLLPCPAACCVPQIISWIGVVFMGLCIVASRKHYSVDVVVAFYTVPLVFYTLHRRWTTKRPVQDYWCVEGEPPGVQGLSRAWSPADMRRACCWHTTDGPLPCSGWSVALVLNGDLALQAAPAADWGGGGGDASGWGH